MSDWNAGYITEIDYTYGYYHELNPLHARFALQYSGLAVPEALNACELGFGQGVSVNLHAAGSSVKWFGTDFNPAQALFAQQLAADSGAGAQLTDQSFAEFCSREDLPDFDYIGLHGIWSWISDESRRQIVDFVRRKLKVGGVLYISYNTLPGWSAFAPLRHLLAQHGSSMSSSGHGILPKVDAAIDFTKRLFKTDPAYGRGFPGIAKRVKKLEENDRHYLAHEYFNHNWVPMYFSEVAQWLEPAKVNFGCSAIFTELVPALSLTAEQRDLLAEIPDPVFRETVHDYMTNVQFRRDYWIKGARRLRPLEQVEQLRKHRVMLLTPRSDVSLKIDGSVMDDNIHNPILDALADHQPRTIADLETAVGDNDINLSQLLRAIVLLLGKNDLTLVRDDADIAIARPHADKLNASLLERAAYGSEIACLTSPVTSGGVPVTNLEQLLLRAYRSGHSTRDELAQSVWQTFQKLGRRVHKDGKLLKSAEDNLAELGNLADKLLTKRLPVFKALQLI